MANIMMKLGEYAFSLSTAAYQNLQRKTSFRWAAQDRHGQHAALQFLGPGEDTLSLSGEIYPHFRGGTTQVEQMRTQAVQGDPLLLVDGTGRIHGMWIIQDVSEKQPEFFSDGVPRKVEFSLNLRYFGEA